MAKNFTENFINLSEVKTNMSGEANMSESANKDGANLPAIFKLNGEEVNLRIDTNRETLWATQDAIASLFRIERSVVTKHIGKIFSSGELDEMNNVQKMHIVKSKKPVNSYTLKETACR